MDTPTPVVENPAPTTAPPSIAAYREAKEKGPVSPAVPTPSAPVVDEPDPEVDADPELREEIDRIEAPKENETPAEKAARTRKHKEAARKGYATRQKNRADREAARVADLERELTELRQRPSAPSGGPPAAVQGSPAPVSVDPSVGPEPTFDTWAQTHRYEDFAAAHPNHPDPYAGWQAEFSKEWNRWDRKRESVEAGRASQAEASRQQMETALADFDRHADPLRREHPDFEAKVHSLLLTPAMTHVIFGAGEMGPRIAYHLATHPAEYQRLARLSHAAQLTELGEIKASVKASLKPATPPPPPVTAAPAPHAPVGAGAATGSTFDPATTTSVEDYRRAKAAGLLPRS